MRRVCFLILSAVVVLSGCKKNESAPGEVRQITARPATPPASGTQDNDTALTQTVEIDENRSSAEGGVLTEGQSASTDGAAASTATAPGTAEPTSTTPPPPSH